MKAFYATALAILSAGSDAQMMGGQHHHNMGDGYGQNNEYGPNNDGYASGMMGSGHMMYSNDREHGGHCPQMQQMMETYCPNVDCTDTEDTNVVCHSWIDASEGVSMSERQRSALHCVCCQGETLLNLEDGTTEEEAAVVLARIMTEAPGMEVEGASVGQNMASRGGLAFLAALAALGAAIAIN